MSSKFVNDDDQVVLFVNNQENHRRQPHNSSASLLKDDGILSQRLSKVTKDIRCLKLAIISLFIFILISNIAWSLTSYEVFQKIHIKSKVVPILALNNASTSEALHGEVGLNETVMTTTTASPDDLEQKREFIRQMAREAWYAYERFAWGHEALQPVTRDSSNWAVGLNSGHTIVSAMSTFWLMGLKSEFETAKLWMLEHADGFAWERIERRVAVYRLETEYIGSLLSCYALTGDEMFWYKAMDIAVGLEPAYNTSTGLPVVQINPSDNSTSNRKNSLSRVFAQLLDYDELLKPNPSRSYNTARIHERARRMRSFMLNIVEPHNGLYMDQIDVQNGTWGSPNETTMLFHGRDFYYSLIKLYRKSMLKVAHGKMPDVEALQTYAEAFDAIMNELCSYSTVPDEHLWRCVPRNCQLASKELCYHMTSWDISGCNLGAMMALAEDALKRDLAWYKMTAEPSLLLSDDYFSKIDQDKRRIEVHHVLAEQLTELCHQAASRTKTGLPPFKFEAPRGDPQSAPGPTSNLFILDPELAESYFIMWRTTHNQKYRDYAWQMAQSIRTHCHVETGGFSTIKNVNEIPTVKYDPEVPGLNYQPAELLSSTLKYLYLTFTNDSVMSLDEWVFNAAGQPYPLEL